ncbi:MAG: VOC family protein [Phycisphaerales bacterium]|nr:VOC family protein [Phycisphaerales bacterium]
MGAIRSVAEVVLNAQDLNALVRFYKDVMGFGFHNQYPKQNPTIVFLEISSSDSPLGTAHPSMLVLIDPDRHPSARGKFDPPTNRAFSLNHLAFEIDEAEYETENARLNSLNISTNLVQFKHVRAKAIFFQDPEGNRLELICHDSSVNEEDAIQADIETDRSIQNAIDQFDSESNIDN